MEFYTVLRPGFLEVGFSDEADAIAYARREVEYLGPLSVFKVIKSFNWDGAEITEEEP